MNFHYYHILMTPQPYYYLLYYYLIIPVQRALADSHGKPCTLVSVFGNVYVECAPCLLLVRLCIQLKEMLLTDVPQLFFFLKIWSANISVHLLVCN